MQSQQVNKSRAGGSVAIFQISETISIDVRKGDYAKPYLLLQEKNWSNDTDSYACKSILVTVCQWSSLKTNFRNIKDLVERVKSGKLEMSMDLGERRLLRVVVKLSADGVVVTFQRVRSKPDASGSMRSSITLTLSDMDKLENWFCVVTSCIRDNSDVPIVDAITDPSQYRSPGVTDRSGLPPKLRPIKLNLAKTVASVGTQTDFVDGFHQTVPQTPVTQLDNPFKMLNPDYMFDEAASVCSSTQGFGNISPIPMDIHQYTPLAKPEDFTFGANSASDNSNSFGYYSPISPTL
ncbi:unnamed protein product [Owenia fusiformis]|uniref:Uncharacterized protein n=1 Tax=Owenia fusiformis TaxID=6347 RepID=A0A8J1UW77_OWEFU|nr:unnamed protein product [Owenia fusiformis]